jgi:competence protein ComEA
MNEKRNRVGFSILLVLVSGFVFFSLGITVAWRWGFPKQFAQVEYPVYYETKTSATTVAFTGIVNLNTATEEELMQIEGIGEKTARSIIDYRDAIGGYVFLEQLLDVPGIGETKLNAWKPYLVLNTASSTSMTTSAISTTTSSLPSSTVTSFVASTTVPTTKFSGVLNLNTATKEELMLINGIGEVTASKIVAYREEIGGFTSLDQLMDIDGIGEKKLAAWRPYLTL